MVIVCIEDVETKSLKEIPNDPNIKNDSKLDPKLDLTESGLWVGCYIVGAFKQVELHLKVVFGVIFMYI